MNRKSCPSHMFTSVPEATRVCIMWNLHLRRGGWIDGQPTLYYSRAQMLESHREAVMRKFLLLCLAIVTVVTLTASACLSDEDGAP